MKLFLKKYGFFFLLFGLVGRQAEAQPCVLSYSPVVKQVQLNDSVTVAYQEAGKGKPTLLMVHGLGGNLSNWSQNLSELSKNYRCIALDLPNYGMSKKYNYTLSADILSFYADVIAQFAKKLKIKKFVLVGHSMGGQTAIITALKYPSLVQKIILASPAGFETFSEQEATFLKNYATPQTFKNQTEPIIRQSFAANFYKLPTTAESLIQDRLTIGKCTDFEPYWASVSAGVKGMLAHPVREQLQQIRQPTLVIFGENDGLIPNKYLHKMLTTSGIAGISKAIPKSEMVLIPEAGHLVMFEQPRIFNQSVINFIK